jgi:hypothetical protein
MTTQYYTGPNYGGKFFRFVLAMALGAAAFAVFVRHSTTGQAGRIATLITGRAVGMDVSVPDVVAKIHRMGRVQTAAYSVDTVVVGNVPPATAHGAPGDYPTLRVVHGESIAGMDMTQVKPEEVRIDAGGRGIHVTLPASQLFSTTMDDRRTRVYSSTDGTLAPADPAQTLTPDVRANAQDQLQQAALTDGILDAASRNARDLLTAQLDAMGFEQVDVQ